MNSKARLYLAMVLAAGLAVLLPATTGRGWNEQDVWMMVGFAAAMAFAERFPIHFPLRKQKVSFSLIDILLTASLFAVPLNAIALVTAVGMLFGQMLRRQPAVKAAFNTAMYAVAGAAAAGTFALIRPASMEQAQAYIAAVAAMAVWFVVNKIIVSIMMTFVEGRSFVRVLASLTDIVLAIWAGSVALGLIAARLYQADRYTLPLLVVPAVLSYTAYRSSVRSKIEISRLREMHAHEIQPAHPAA